MAGWLGVCVGEGWWVGGVMGWRFGWRRGIGEVSGEKLGTVVTVMCTVRLTGLNKLHSWSKHANNLVSLVFVMALQDLKIKQHVMRSPAQ